MSDSVTSHYRACHLCEAICGLEITTQGREILAIRGDKADPFSRGHICPKATALQDLHTDNDRLRQPVKRVANGWQTVSWEEAIALAGEWLGSIQRQHGNDAVALYAGNPSVHNYGTMTHGGLIRKALKTRNCYSATSLDQLPHQLLSLALYGHQALIPVPDIDRSRLMVIIGGNPLASNGSMMTVPDVTKRLKAIQSRGGRLVVIDPRRTETAEIADHHHFIRPGSDGFLLLAIIHTILAEEWQRLGHLSEIVDGVDAVRIAVAPFTPARAAAATGIAEATIRSLAQALAETDGAVCYGRMGVSTQAFGSLCQWAIQVINILIGALDSEGGALFCSPAFGHISRGARGAGHFNRWQSRVSGLPEYDGEFPSVVLAEEMLTEGPGQVRGLLTIAGNPVLSAPDGQGLDRALAGLEYMVAIDFYINETTRHAQVILPPTGPLEHDHYDIAFHRLAVRNTARYNQPVFEPPAGSRHDWQILNELSIALAGAKGEPLKPLPAPAKLLDQGLQYGLYGAASDAPQALSLARLQEYPHGLDLGPLQPGLAERLCTDNGRIQLAVDFILADIPRLNSATTTLAGDQLLLIGRRHVRSNNSWLHNAHRLVKGKPRWQLLMHPDDLAQRQLADGSQVRIESRVGAVQTTVVASDEVMPGVVSLPHGWGHQRGGVQLAVASQQGGVSCNDLTDPSLFDAVSGNAALNGVPVRVMAVG
ncbi:molybdopterin-dependent oxidoreductase [Halioxenophilus sp. WMMB6]|uniref:molybdopterin-dependent oxidoreductase n=1 Tax=Halioxenophilus sp. WMMB6 TaxID=3073815 RepID=UPI00295E2571|nr:molybdopterin-dependent oxidoreductase [Halioxenophilus sp. WMMB6]